MAKVKTDYCLFRSTEFADDGWLLGLIRSRHDGYVLVSRLDTNDVPYAEEIRVDLNNASSVEAHPQLVENVHAESLHESLDLLDIPNLNHEGLLLHHIRRQFRRQRPYTSVGSIVVAVNPRTTKLSGYDLADFVAAAGDPDAVARLPPHTYAVAERAYTNLLRSPSKKPQFLLMSGVSGAGKTVATNMAMAYLVSRSSRASGADNAARRVASRLEAASVVLEAMGNAATARNDNSSRFAKLVRVYFNSGGIITGAKIQTYLLEKSRVITHGRNERLYHAFYYLVAHKGFGHKFPMVQPGIISADDCIGHEDRQPDEEKFTELESAMTALGFPEDFQAALWRVLEGILHWQAVELPSAGNCTVDEAARQRLAEVARLWGTAVDDLVLLLTQDDQKNKRSAPAGRDLRNSISQYVYCGLFDKIVAMLNDALQGTESQMWIGLLDMFGFETFEKNSFEQLCINYANEKLQQHYNDHLFKLDLEVYRAENVDVRDVHAPDNEPTLALIRDVFVKLGQNAQEGMGESNVGGSRRTLEDLERRHASVLTLPEPVVDRKAKAEQWFRVRHYCETVSYDLAGMKQKNLFQLPFVVVAQLQKKSNCPFFRDFVWDKKSTTGRGGGTGVRIESSVALGFQNSMEELVRLLETTEPYWVRCVKPHPVKKPGLFHSVDVLEQLRSAGVLATIDVRRQGFPCRLSFQHFRDRFCILLDESQRKLSSKAACEAIIGRLEHGGVKFTGDKAVQICKTLLFLKEKAMEECEAHRTQHVKELFDRASVCVTCRRLSLWALKWRERRWSLLAEEEALWQDLEETESNEIANMQEQFLATMPPPTTKVEPPADCEALPSPESPSLSRVASVSLLPRAQSKNKVQLLQLLAAVQTTKHINSILKEEEATRKAIFPEEDLSRQRIEMLWERELFILQWEEQKAAAPVIPQQAVFDFGDAANELSMEEDVDRRGLESEEDAAREETRTFFLDALAGLYRPSQVSGCPQELLHRTPGAVAVVLASSAPKKSLPPTAALIVGRYTLLPDFVNQRPCFASSAFNFIFFVPKAVTSIPGEEATGAWCIGPRLGKAQNIAAVSVSAASQPLLPTEITQWQVITEGKPVELPALRVVVGETGLEFAPDSRAASVSSGSWQDRRWHGDFVAQAATGLLPSHSWRILECGRVVRLFRAPDSGAFEEVWQELTEQNAAMLEMKARVFQDKRISTTTIAARLAVSYPAHGLEKWEEKWTWTLQGQQLVCSLAKKNTVVAVFNLRGATVEQKRGYKRLGFTVAISGPYIAQNETSNSVQLCWDDPAEGAVWLQALRETAESTPDFGTLASSESVQLVAGEWAGAVSTYSYRVEQQGDRIVVYPFSQRTTEWAALQHGRVTGNEVEIVSPIRRRGRIENTGLIQWNDGERWQQETLHRLGPFGTKSFLAHTTTLSFDKSTMQYSLTSEGKTYRGSCSPFSSVTLPPKLRSSLLIPQEPKDLLFCFIYPSPKPPTAGPLEQFLSVGGYAYLDFAHQLQQCNGIGLNGDALRFVGPYPLPRKIAEAIAANKCWEPVTIKELKAQRAEAFSWLCPSQYDQILLKHGLPTAPAGAFCYKFANEKYNRYFVLAE